MHNSWPKTCVGVSILHCVLLAQKLCQGLRLVGSSFTNKSRYIHIYIYLYRLGGCSTGKLFRFVGACVRAVWLPIVELDLKSCWSSLFTFSLGALSLFPLGPWASYPTLVRLIGVYFLAMYNEPHSAIYLSLSLSLSLYIQPGRLGHPPKSLCMDGYEEPN